MCFGGGSTAGRLFGGRRSPGWSSTCAIGPDGVAGAGAKDTFDGDPHGPSHIAPIRKHPSNIMVTGPSQTQSTSTIRVSTRHRAMPLSILRGFRRCQP